MQKTHNNEYQVTPLELFFDLVFVFAISQLSHHLLEHLTWQGAGETAVMVMAVLTVWSFTSWAATMIPVHQSKSGLMLLCVMLVGLLMNASINNAFEGAGWAFVVPLLTIQIARTLWTIWYSPNTEYKEHYYRLLIWLLATLPLWIVGATAPQKERLLWWAGSNPY